MLHFYQTSQCHIPEDNFHSHCHENLESEMCFLFVFSPNCIKITLKNMYLFTMLVNNINSDVLSTV
jgi:hypothetical protein